MPSLTAPRSETSDDNPFALNPTGGAVRTEGMDKWGGGEYLARRNDDSSGLSIHHAIDYVGRVGDPVVAPISGVLTRTGSGPNTGAVILGRIRGSKYRVRLMHFTVTVRDGFVVQGRQIGKVKDLGRTYPGITPHVHMEVQEWKSYVGYRFKDPAIVVKSEEELTLR